MKNDYSKEVCKEDRLPMSRRTIKLPNGLGGKVKEHGEQEQKALRWVVDEALDAELLPLVESLRKLGLKGEVKVDKLVRVPLDDNVIGRLNLGRRQTGLTADKWAFAYDDKGHYLPSNGYILTSSEIPIKYLLAILNSNLMKFYFSFIGIMTAGGAFTLKRETIREFRLKDIPANAQKPFIDLVEKILSLTGDEDYLENTSKQANVRSYEKEINKMVYELYGLDEKEIAIVESNEN